MEAIGWNKGRCETCNKWRKVVVFAGEGKVEYKCDKCLKKEEEAE